MNANAEITTTIANAAASNPEGAQTNGSSRNSSSARRAGWVHRPSSYALNEIGRSRDGYLVFDRPNSHVHMGHELLREVIDRVSLANREFVPEQVNFETEIGSSTCVETSVADQIVYAHRPNRKGASRFVLHRKPKPSSSAVAIFKRSQGHPQGYVLITAFIGTMPEPEPWDKFATSASREFWASHALIWNSCEVLLDTMTLICPWA